MNIVSSGNIIDEIAINFGKRYPDVNFYWCKDMEEAQAHLPEAEILITYGEDLTEELIHQAVKLKWIMVVSAGMDEMPFEAIEKAGILVTNAKGIHAVPMAEYVMHMMLHRSRQAEVIQQQEKEHRWDRSPVMTELHGKTVCIVGTGAIGTEAARLAEAFRMHIVGVNRSGSRPDVFDEIYTVKDLHTAAASADFIVSILPKMSSTDNLFSQETFRHMKSTAVFINVGRGNAVDEEALIQALNHNEFQHAVLDVFKEEPLQADHPFWEHPKVTVTPHLSGISPQYQPRAMKLFEKNLRVYLSGEDGYINQVDPSKGY